MTNPIDVAWDVVKGEAFHPSVTGYMSRARHLSDSPNIGMRMKRPMADVQNRQFERLYGEGVLDRSYPLRRRSEVPMAEHMRSEGFGNPLAIQEYAHRTTNSNQAHIPMFIRNIEKPVGPTGMPDTGLHYDGAFSDLDGADRSRAPVLAIQTDMPQMITRSSDTPIDTAWSILKELSREDLRHAARTGGIPMTEARRQAYQGEGKKLGTGGGFRTMPDTEAQRMIAEQHRMRQGPFDSGDMRDANDIEIAGASIEDPSFAERYDPEPEIDPELSQFQTGDTSSNPFERAIHPIEQKRRQKAYEQHLMEQQRQRMAQAQRPQMSQSSRARRPGESKNAYRKRMSRR